MTDLDLQRVGNAESSGVPGSHMLSNKDPNLAGGGVYRQTVR